MGATNKIMNRLAFFGIATSKLTFNSEWCQGQIAIVPDASCELPIQLMTPLFTP